MLNIEDLHWQDLKNDKHSSIFLRAENYEMLIIRIPFFKNEIKIEQNGFIINGSNIFHFDKNSDSILLKDESFTNIHKILDQQIDEVLLSIDAYGEDILEIEEHLYSDNLNDKLISVWFENKRDLSRMDRVLSRSLLVIQNFDNYYKNNEKYPKYLFSDIIEHLERSIRNIGLLLNKLDYIYEFHTSRTNEKINKSVYLLTILSAIFLPLNLIVGFFGMNTTSLPFTQNEGGTFWVVFILLFIATSFLLFYLGKKLLKTYKSNSLKS